MLYDKLLLVNLETNISLHLFKEILILLVPENPCLFLLMLTLFNTT